MTYKKCNFREKLNTCNFKEKDCNSYECNFYDLNWNVKDLFARVKREEKEAKKLLKWLKNSSEEAHTEVIKDTKRKIKDIEKGVKIMGGAIIYIKRTTLPQNVLNKAKDLLK